MLGQNFIQFFLNLFRIECSTFWYKSPQGWAISTILTNVHLWVGKCLKSWCDSCSQVIHSKISAICFFGHRKRNWNFYPEHLDPASALLIDKYSSKLLSNRSGYSNKHCDIQAVIHKAWYKSTYKVYNKFMYGAIVW